MGLDINKIKAKELLVKNPMAIRPYKSDIPKLKKLAKGKGMKLHSFLVEILHFVVKNT